MDWDLGLEGIALLGAISLGFGVLAGLLVGDGWRRRAWTTVGTVISCFGVGLLTSEWLFGWATEQDLQPNIDGLSRDEVLLSSLLTTVIVVVVTRHFTRRAHEPAHYAARHLVGLHRGHRVGH